MQIGSGTVVGPNVVVLGPTTIGERCWIGPGCVIGTTSEDLGHMVVPQVPEEPVDDEALEALLWHVPMGKGVEIGDRTILRELTTVQQGTVAPTVVGSDCFVMDKCHIAHDNRIGDRVTLACFTAIAGHVVIGDDATIGLHVSIHQRRVIGSGAMVGMQSAVTRDVRPFDLVKGSPARPGGINRVRLERMDIAPEDIAALEAFYDGSSAEVPASFADVLAAWEATRR